MQKSGATNEMLETVVKKSGNLDEVYRIVQREGSVLWLEEGTSSWGWKHILRNNRNIQIKNHFRLSNSDDAVKDLIQQGLEQGTKLSNNIIDYAVRGINGKLRIVIGTGPKKAGSVITAYPM